MQALDPKRPRSYAEAMQNNTSLPLQMPEGFDALTRAEKLRFLAALWERVDVGDDDTDVHEEIVAKVVNSRLDELRERPDIALSADEVLERVRRRLQG